MHLDIRTLIVVAIFVAVVTSAICALVWYTRPTYPGFGRWTLGNLLAAISLVFLALRGVAPDWSSVVLANMLAVGAAILFFQGVRLFCGLRLYGWPEYLAGSIVISAVIYFRYSTNNTDARILALSLLMSSLGLANGITLLRAAPAGSGFSMRFTGIVFSLVGAVHLSRGIYIYTMAPVADIFAPSAVNAVFFGFASLGLVCWSFGFILMTGEGQAMVGVESMCRADGGKTVTEAEIHQQVQRIVMSDGFRRSARMERFLRVAVERTLLGRTEDLKEYALGRDVFNRVTSTIPATTQLFASKLSDSGANCANITTPVERTILSSWSFTPAATSLPFVMPRPQKYKFPYLRLPAELLTVS